MARKRQFCTRRFRAVLVFLGFALPMIVWLPSVLLLLGGWIRGHGPVMICASVLRLCWPGFSVGLVSNGIGLQRVFFPSGISFRWVLSFNGIASNRCFLPVGLASGGCFPSGISFRRVLSFNGIGSQWNWLSTATFSQRGLVFGGISSQWGLAFNGCFLSAGLTSSGCFLHCLDDLAVWAWSWQMFLSKR